MEISRGSDEVNTLYSLTSGYSARSIYSTFIGVGIDFDTDIVSQLTKIKATNYTAIHSAKDFKKMMEADFDYLMSPNMFNGRVTFDSDAWKVERVYGSPGNEYPSNGVLMTMVSKSLEKQY